MTSKETKKGRKRSFILAIVVILFICLNLLGLNLTDFLPSENGIKILKEFSSEALSPAKDYEDKFLRTYAPPYYIKVLTALWLTLQYATCAITIAILIGISMGFLCSKSWWIQTKHSWSKHLILAFLHRTARTIITFGRSIHELLWALLFITAFGTSPFAAIMALAIPYGCTLAKVFSEIIDEQDRENSQCLLCHGASPVGSWLFGILPPAIPDLLSYTLYRYECAIRSAAILGFVGVSTIGYHIETAFEDGYFNEVWTLLYSLFLLLIFVEKTSSYIRGKINTPLEHKITSLSPITRKDAVEKLRQEAPKKISLYVILTLLGLLTFLAWNTGEPMLSDLSSEQRAINLKRFITQEITPYPVRISKNWADAIPWAISLIAEKGLTAALQTLYIATAAISIAFLAGLLTIPYSSRSLNSSHYFGITLGLSTFQIIGRKIISIISKFILMITRSMPEFLIAFLTLQIFGPTAWPLILGLALHNYGIIGRLGGEMLDNADPSNAKIAIAHGGATNKLYLFILLPNIFNRFILYFFYRWETCIRDATVMGMLGISSLGFLIDDAKARDNRDEMLLYILFGACIVIIGDIISDIVRERLRSS